MEIEELDIKNFYSIVETKIELTEQVRKLHGKELAPDFNSFDFWWIDENKVSEIISFFLNPNGKHDQGDIYLKHFLKKFNLQFFNFDNSDKINVKCEYRTDFDRRIDIVIIKNSFEQAIGIENKIHTTTKDQKNQLLDYSKFLNKKTDGNYCLIYLSPKGKVVSEDSITQEDKVNLENSNRLITLTYEDDIIQCIAEFSLLTVNVRVKAFLNDLEKKLKFMYMGEKNLDTEKIVANYINENKKNLKVSFLIANSLQEVKKDLIQKMELQIEEVGKELGLEIMGNLKLKPTNWKNNYIRFNFESGGLLYDAIIWTKINIDLPK
jgi:hypothetical protein